MIAIRQRTFIIKVLFFIVSLLSLSRLEDDTQQPNVPKKHYIIDVFTKTIEQVHFFNKNY